jgi:hypothetical protein
MKSKLHKGSRTVFQHTKDVVSEETGEILSSEVVASIEVPIKGIEDFFILFGNSIKAIYRLNGAEKDVFLWAAMHVNINSPRITLNMIEKQVVAHDTGHAVGTVNNAIQGLSKKGIFIREGRGSYAIDPQYAWKGKMNEREKARKERKVRITFAVEDND